MTASRSAYVLVALAAALFSTGGAAIKATRLSDWQVAGWRSGIAALVLFATVKEARRPPSPAALLVALAYAATMLLFVLSNRETTAASTVFLQSTAPVWVLVLGIPLLGERARRDDLVVLLAIAAGFALLLGQPDLGQATAPRPLVGNVLGAAAGLTWGLTLIGLRRLGRAGESGVPAIVAGNALAFCIALPFATGGTAGAGALDWLVLGWLGVFQIGLAYVCLGSALRRVRAFEASLLLLLEPVLSPVFAWLVHREQPGAWTLAGGAVVVAALVARAVLRRPAVPDPGRSAS